MKMGWRFYILGLAAMSMVLSMVQLVESTVPALFVFGDSLLDTGNNNNLSTLVKASSPPYGDYPAGGSGGRFSNGPVTTDFFAAQLNLPCPPPYMTMGDDIERGVNFASGGSGILDATGEVEGEHISLGDQIKNFQDAKNKLIERVGTNMASSIISRAIFLVTTGSNDYFNHYSIPSDPAYALYFPADFEDLLISTYTSHLVSLYNLGARKITLSSMPAIGCTPFARQLYGTEDGGCVSFLQESAQSYNKRLFTVVQQLQAQLPGSRFMYNNIYDSSMEIYQNPTRYGIVNEKDACCGGSVNFGLCNDGIPLCADSSQYYYFDGYHPTSLVHRLTTTISFTGSPPFVFPHNLQTFASLP